jgi:hypothetical protein
MSRSRYHTLSWSFTRIRGRLRGHKRTHRTGVTTGRAGNSAPLRNNGFQGGFLARTFRSIVTIFLNRGGAS